ncbi:MAG TPA: PhzA/PhzB family protein [Jatrophihabitans sp.]|nr:PhzA/PhzB family protein [Jatrophihabitans sp.]
MSAAPVSHQAGSEARAHNRAVVEDYLSRTGQSRLTRYQLFADDGVGGLWTTDTGSPVASHGIESLKAHGEWSLRIFPDWRWYDITVFETQDPDWLWAECDGEGQILFPDYPPGFYRNHFLHSFRFRDGKIVEQREFMNPFQQLRSLGIPVPEIRRGGFPD